MTSHAHAASFINSWCTPDSLPYNIIHTVYEHQHKLSFLSRSD